MKLKNFAMITEDKVFRKLKETPEIFCIADDFCKVFDAMMEKYTLKSYQLLLSFTFFAMNLEL